jgi:hypothetical protein
MKFHFWRSFAVFAFVAGPHLWAADAASMAAWQRFRARSAEAIESLSRLEIETPSGDVDTVELSFSEFFEPVGDGGLEYAARLRSLDGKRVRLSGYMLRDARRHRGVFILVPRPATPGSDGTCSAQDVPPNAVHVHLPAGSASSLVPYQPGRIVLSGTLSIGPKREMDGRNSAVRLILETPSEVAAASASHP